ncbi:MAG: heme biosynthesis HemY N-terminal domain-containing protein [Aeromonas sp.]
MIRLLILVAALVAGLAFGPQAAGNKGYVLIALGNYTVESSATSAAILLVLLYGALLALEWLLRRLFGLRSKTRGWYGLRQRRKANERAVAATLALAEGQYAQAEKLVLKSVDNSDTPLLNYLTAAKAAAKRGDTAQSELYLQQAQASHPEAELALTLTQSQLLISQQQYANAFARLEPLYAMHPRHPMVLEQLRQVHTGQHNWAALCDLLASLVKAKKLSASDEQELLESAWQPHLAAATTASELTQLWAEAPKAARQSAALQAHYGQCLCALGAHSEAAKAWSESLKKAAPSAILAALPTLQLDDYQPLIALLKKKQHEAGVAPVLAEFLLRAGQLDDAQALLEQLVHSAPSVATYHALGELMDKRRLTVKANEYYRQALALRQA